MAIIGSLPYTLTNGSYMDANLVMSDLNYVQSQTNSNAAPITSPVFIGSPSAPSPLAGDSSTNLATTYFVSQSFPGKNFITNADCSIAQVNGATLVTPLTGTWPIDMNLFVATQASKLQTQQVFTGLNSLGATSSLKTTVLASYTPLAGDIFAHFHTIEGFNFARLQYGTANAKASSLQFKVNASVSGTYSGSINNAASTRSYTFAYTVAANTDTLVTVQNIPGDTGGVWVGAGNAASCYVTFDLGCGTSSRTGSGSWQAGAYYGVSGAGNLVSQVNGTSLTITDVQLETGGSCSLFERKTYQQNLLECMRYYQSVDATSVIYCAGAQAIGVAVNFPVPMRAVPSATQLLNNHFLTQANVAATTSTYTSASSVSGIYVSRTTSGAGAAQFSEIVGLSAQI